MPQDVAPWKPAWSEPATTTDQGQCKLELGDQFHWDCNVEINIFTETRPEDIFAIAALFRKANEVSLSLGCRPEEYPIKAIFGGGGYHSQTWHDELCNTLGVMQEANILPNEDSFDIGTQVYPGPTAIDADHLRYDVLAGGEMADEHQRIWTPPESTTYSLKRTMRASMGKLISQRAPINVALRPPYEFALLWSEYALDQPEPRFVPQDRYEELMRRGETANDDRWVNSMENVANGILAFRRSRMIMFQGTGHFARMGRFFGEPTESPSVMERGSSDAENQIHDANNPVSVQENVRLLEETFVTWPQQFLLVDQNSMLSTTRHPKRHVFDEVAQTEAYRALGRIPFLSRHLRSLIVGWNRAVSLELFKEVLRYIGAETRPGERAEHERLIRELEIRYIRRHHSPSRADHQPFVTIVWELAQRLSAMLRWRLGGWAAPEVIARPTIILHRWGHIAWLEDSYIPADNLLLPLCADPSSVVRESFRKVTYGGRVNRRGPYVWTDASEFSGSTVWFTNSSAAATADPDGREDRIIRELKDLYVAAFTPLILP
ncbi:MAG: hypothetical protein M1832_003130 [Thelocarpon impressellum]|nr:MAG: hypothetical protein M1832_003130 [Thelocarpon impressellum]